MAIVNISPKANRRLLAAIITIAVFTLALTVTAFMQEAAKPATAERVQPSLISQGALAPDAITVATYPFTNFSGVALEDMSSGTTQLVAANQEDTASSVNNIGFDFWFDGLRQTQFSVNANGLMKLGSSAVNTLPTNDLANTANAPQIAPYWDDLFTGTNGKVHYKTLGSAPNRKLVVEWQNMQIPRVGFSNPGAGTFQGWLYETTGVIEFVYGSGIAINSANLGYSVGFGTTGTFASVTSSGPTVAYGSSTNNQTNAITSGTKYTFTPLVPSDPTGLNFTGVTQTSMTLNWTDNSSNELGFAIYRSDDGGSTYNFVTQAAAGATSSVQTPLLPGTTYFWKVFAVTEGALSAIPAASSNPTAAAGNITSTASGGLWSSTATWVGGVVPTATDNVTIADGATVTIDVTNAVCFNLTVGQGTSGILEYHPTSASTLTVSGDATVATNGTFSAGSGALTTHILNIGGSFSSISAGNLTVDGTFDLNTTAGVTTNFLGNANGTVSGAGPTCDFWAIGVTKGANPTSVLNVSRVITMSAPASAGNRLVVTGGTFKLSSASTITPYFGSQTVVAIAGRLWINNASASIQCVGAGVSATGGGSPIINGILQVDAGTFGYGQGSDVMSLQGSLIIGGANGIVNMFGRVITGAAATFTMTAGNFNVDPQNISAAAANDVFNLSTASVVNFTGGVLTIVDPGLNNAIPANTEFEVAGAGSKNFAGSTIRFGDGTSSSSGNASSGGFSISAPGTVTLGTIVINNPAGINRNVRISNIISGTCNVTALTLTAGTFNLNGSTLTNTGNASNDGIINGDSSGSIWSFIGATQQTVSGSGGYTNNRIRGLTINNSSAASPAVNFNQSIAVATAMNLTLGSIGGSGVLTLGDSAGSTTLTTTRSGGSLANTPTFNLSGVTYNVTYTAPSPAASITTGAELPGSISGTLTISNSSGVSLNSPLTVNAGLTLSSGLLATTATNLLTLGSAVVGPTGSASSHVDGPLAVDIPTTAAISRNYAIGKGAFFRPVTLSSLTLAAQSIVTAEVVNSASGGTPVAPLVALDAARYWQLSNSTALNPAARIQLTYGVDDNVFDTSTARVAQSSTTGGSYSSIGGTVSGTTSSGTIISTTNLTPGSDFFTIGNESALPTTWDGGAATSNWGDAANWSNDTVPDGTTNVSLIFGSPTTINVNGTFAVKNLTVGTNTTLNLGSGTLNFTGNYIQSGGTLNINTGNLNVSGTSSLNGGTMNVNSGTYLSTGALTLNGGTLANGTGTLNCKGDFTLSTGSFTAVTGAAGSTTIFSGTTTQNIAGFSGGTSLNNLTLQGGGAGLPKNFTAGRAVTAANDFIVATTAQVALSAATATTINVGGNLNYGGVTGGTNIGSLNLNLTGTNKTINGTALSIPQRDTATSDLSLVKTETINMFSDPRKYARVPKDRSQLESTYSKKRDEVNALIAKKEATTRLIINLDDATIVSNPMAHLPLAPTPSAFEMNLTVASGGGYTMLDNISIATGKTLTVTGRLNADTFTIGGAGNITVTGSTTVGDGILGTATTSALGLAATLVNSGINTFTDAIIEYNASGAQTINATNHPSAAMIYTAGSGTKTLNGNKIISGSSGDPLTKGALFVGAGTTFADGGFTISFTSALGFDNVIVNGTYLSTGAGGLSYESGPTLSSIQAVDGTQFGNLALNFLFSDDAMLLNAPTAIATTNISFRDLTLGGATGAGTAGGTLLLNQTGITNVTINGNINISPLTTSNTGGGFDGTIATIGTVTVKGNITSTSTNATQPIFDSNGTNTLIMGHPSILQTLTFGANATIFTGSTLRIDNPAGMQLGGATPRTITLGSGGTMLVSAGASFLTGNNTFINSGTTTINGSFVISAGGAASGGAGTYSYHPTTGTLVFNTTVASTIDASRTYWPSTNGPQNVSVIGTAGLSMSVARTVGILFQTTAGVAGANSLTFNGICKINTGGSFATAPNYGSSSLLIYNSGGTFGRGFEWSALSAAGFPNDVQLSSNTTLNLGNGGAGTARALARDLTIDSGSTLSMAITVMTAGLTVGRNVLINGTLTLSSSANGNINVAGNWTNNGTFNNNTRTATFNGAATQVITGATTFGSLTLANTSGGIDASAASTNLTVNGVLTMTQNTDVKLVNLVTDTTNILIMGAASTATTAGTGQGEVVGTVRRTNFSSGTSYSFGSPFVQFGTFTFTGAPTQIDVTLTQGSPDTFANSVRRNYQINVTGGTITSTILRLHYRDDVTTLNGNAEASLDLWRGPATWTDVGATTRDAANNWVEKTAVNTFSPWTLANTGNAPTAVRLTKFNAASYVDGVQLTWESGFEVDNLGYHVYRERQGKRTRVTPAVVAGSALTVGPGSRLTAGYSYSWFDPKGTADTCYYLEAIDLNGARQCTGPIYPYNNGSSNSSPKRQQALLLNDLADSARVSGTNDESAWPAAMKVEARRETLNLTASGLAVQQSIASGEAIKIQVNRTGWHRLTQPELVAAGFDSTSDARLLQLYVDGAEVPIELSNNRAHLDNNDTLEFYGIGLDTPTTDTRTYWLITGDSAGKRIPVRHGKPKQDYQNWTDTPTGSFAYTTEKREKLVYLSHLLNGDADNIFGAPIFSEPVIQTLSVNNLDSQANLPGQLEVALQGLTEQAHQVQVQFNGSDVGAVTFSGVEHPVATFNVNRALLHAGDNEVSLVSANGDLDISFIDSIRLTYAHQYRADNNTLAFNVAGGQAVRVAGFTTPNIRLIDVTNPSAPLEVATNAASSQGGYAVVVPALGSEVRTLIAFTDDLSRHPASVLANSPSNWNASTNGADMVIITHQAFRQAIEPLATLRRNQGLSVAVVDVEDVYDEFSYGAHTPVALKSFLSQAALSWSRKPAYLLLVGDSTWDPRNYLDQGFNDFVPTKLIDTSYMETGSDDWFADFNSAGLPSMAIGRLPARTPAEVNLMVAKILSYEQERELNAPLRGAVMVADNGFENQSSQTAALLPSGIDVQTINRSQVGNDDLARGQIVNALNQGPMIVNYYGHGSVGVWTGEALLDVDSVTGLTNTNRLSLYVMMTCLNGYSHDVYVDSLGESALKAPNGGAVAVWASSGFTEAPPQFAMDKEFYLQLFGSQPLRLGEAMRNAKGAISDPDVRRTWMLLGDPTMRMH